MKDEHYMREALIEARSALSRGEIPVGCVIVKNDTIIARAGNRREELSDPCAHAEALAIREAANACGWRLTGCELYVTLEPCPMCAGAILESRIARVIYGAPDTKRGACGSVYDIPEDAAIGGSARCFGGVLEAECASLLSEFFKKARESEQ